MGVSNLQGELGNIGIPLTSLFLHFSGCVANLDLSVFIHLVWAGADPAGVLRVVLGRDFKIFLRKFKAVAIRAASDGV